MSIDRTCPMRELQLTLLDMGTRLSFDTESHYHDDQECSAYVSISFKARGVIHAMHFDLVISR